MIPLAIFFLAVAIVAAVLGFGFVANLAFDIAKLLFFVFIILFLIALFFGVRP